MKTYFKDNFFSAGKTDIWNEQLVSLGFLDLKGAFSSALEVYDSSSMLMYRGRFPLLSGTWQVFNSDQVMVGRLRSKFTFFAKKYTYEAYGRGSFFITSPAFSRDYHISDVNGSVAATFQRVSGWFSSEAYCLDNTSLQLNNYELVAVIMGMNAIQKRRRSSSSA
jgi:hypothetical protein